MGTTQRSRRHSSAKMSVTSSIILLFATSCVCEHAPPSPSETPPAASRPLDENPSPFLFAGFPGIPNFPPGAANIPHKSFNPFFGSHPFQPNGAPFPPGFVDPNQPHLFPNSFHPPQPQPLPPPPPGFFGTPGVPSQTFPGASFPGIVPPHGVPGIDSGQSRLPGGFRFPEPPSVIHVPAPPPVLRPPAPLPGTDVQRKSKENSSIFKIPVDASGDLSFGEHKLDDIDIGDKTSSTTVSVSSAPENKAHLSPDPTKITTPTNVASDTVATGTSSTTSPPTTIFNNLPPITRPSTTSSTTAAPTTTSSTTKTTTAPTTTSSTIPPTTTSSTTTPPTTTSSTTTPPTATSSTTTPPTTTSSTTTPPTTISSTTTPPTTTSSTTTPPTTTSSTTISTTTTSSITTPPTTTSSTTTPPTTTSSTTTTTTTTSTPATTQSSTTTALPSSSTKMPNTENTSQTTTTTAAPITSTSSTTVVAPATTEIKTTARTTSTTETPNSTEKTIRKRPSPTRNKPPLHQLFHQSRETNQNRSRNQDKFRSAAERAQKNKRPEVPSILESLNSHNKEELSTSSSSEHPQVITTLLESDQFQITDPSELAQEKIEQTAHDKGTLHTTDSERETGAAADNHQGSTTGQSHTEASDVEGNVSSYPNQQDQAEPRTDTESNQNDPLNDQYDYYYYDYDGKGGQQDFQYEEENYDASDIASTSVSTSPSTTTTTTSTTTTAMASVSPTTRTTVLPTAKSDTAGRPLSRTQKLLMRIQRLRQRRLTSSSSTTTLAPRSLTPKTPVRLPLHKTTADPEKLRPGFITRKFHSRRRPTPRTSTSANDFYNRLKNRIFTTSAPSNNNPVNKREGESTSKPPTTQAYSIYRNGPTTAKTLSFRERLKLYRQNNRFIPANRRTSTRPTTTASTTTSTVITTTTEATISVTGNDYDYITEYKPVTPSSITESTTVSKLQGIRDKIANMLTASGLSGTTTTEEVLSILDEVTVKPLHTFESSPATDASIPRANDESGIDTNPIISIHPVGEDLPTEIPLDELLSTIIDTISTTNAPFTTSAYVPTESTTRSTVSILGDTSFSISSTEAGSTTADIKLERQRSASTTESTVSPPTHTTQIVADLKTTGSDEVVAALSQTSLEETVSNPITRTLEETATAYTTTNPLFITSSLAPSSSVGSPIDDATLASTEQRQEPVRVHEEAVEDKDPQLQNLISRLLSQGLITVAKSGGDETNTTADYSATTSGEQITTERIASITVQEKATTEPTASATSRSSNGATTKSTTNIMTEPSTVATTEPNTVAITEPGTSAITEPSTTATTKPTISIAIEPSTSAATEPSTSAATEPSTSAATEPSTSAATESSTSAATEPSTIAAIESSTSAATEPSTSAASEPSTSAATEPSTSASTEPSTSASTEPSTSASTEPSTSAATVPSTSASTEPSTSASTKPITSAATVPSTSAATEPSTSAETEPSTSAATEPSTSAATEPSTSAATEPSTSPTTLEITSVTTQDQVTTKHFRNTVTQEETTPEPFLITAIGEQKPEAPEITTAKFIGTTEEMEESTTISTTIPMTTLLNEDLSVSSGEDVTHTPPPTSTTGTDLEYDTSSPKPMSTVTEEQNQITTSSFSITPSPRNSQSIPVNTIKFPSRTRFPILSRQRTTGKPTTKRPKTVSFQPFSTNPLVSKVKMMDTTTMFNRNNDDSTTNLPDTANDEDMKGDHDTLYDFDFFETPTSASVTHAPELPEIRLAENEVDAADSIDNLQMLLFSFGSSSVRPELAAMNRVLSLSLSANTSDDNMHSETDLGVSDFVNDNQSDDRLEPAATEQVLAAVSLTPPTAEVLTDGYTAYVDGDKSTTMQEIVEAETVAPTVLNMGMASISISEMLPKVHSVKDGVISEMETSTGDASGSNSKDTESMPTINSKDTENMPTIASPKMNPEAVRKALNETEPNAGTDDQMSPMKSLQNMSLKEEMNVSKRVSELTADATVARNNRNKIPPQISRHRHTIRMPSHRTTRAPDSDNNSLHNMNEESNSSPQEPQESSGSLSKAAERERQRLLWLRREREGRKPTSRGLHASRGSNLVPISRNRNLTTTSAPSSRSRLSLSELLSQRASTKKSTETSTTEKMEMFSLSTSFPTPPTTVRSTTRKPKTVAPLVSAGTTPAAPDTTENVDAINANEAFMKFLALNKQMLQRLTTQRNRTPSTPKALITTTPVPGFRNDDVDDTTEIILTITETQASQLSGQRTIPRAFANRFQSKAVHSRPSSLLRPVSTPDPVSTSSANDSVRRVKPNFIVGPPHTSASNKLTPRLPSRKVRNRTSRPRLRRPPSARTRRPRPGSRFSSPRPSNDASLKVPLSRFSSPRPSVQEAPPSTKAEETSRRPLASFLSPFSVQTTSTTKISTIAPATTEASISVSNRGRDKFRHHQQHHSSKPFLAESDKEHDSFITSQSSESTRTKPPRRRVISSRPRTAIPEFIAFTTKRPTTKPTEATPSLSRTVVPEFIAFSTKRPKPSISTTASSVSRTAVPEYISFTTKHPKSTVETTTISQDETEAATFINLDETTKSFLASLFTLTPEKETLPPATDLSPFDDIPVTTLRPFRFSSNQGTISPKPNRDNTSRPKLHPQPTSQKPTRFGTRKPSRLGTATSRPSVHPSRSTTIVPHRFSTPASSISATQRPSQSSIKMPSKSITPPPSPPVDQTTQGFTIQTPLHFGSTTQAPSRFIIRKPSVGTFRPFGQPSDSDSSQDFLSFDPDVSIPSVTPTFELETVEPLTTPPATEVFQFEPSATTVSPISFLPDTASPVAGISTTQNGNESDNHATPTAFALDFGTPTISPFQFKSQKTPSEFDTSPKSSFQPVTQRPFFASTTEFSRQTSNKDTLQTQNSGFISQNNEPFFSENDPEINERTTSPQNEETTTAASHIANSVSPQIILVALPVTGNPLFGTDNDANGNPSDSQTLTNDNIPTDITPSDDNIDNIPSFPPDTLIPPQSQQTTNEDQIDLLLDLILPPLTTTTKPQSGVKITSEQGIISQNLQTTPPQQTLSERIKLTAQEGFIPRDFLFPPDPPPSEQQTQTPVLTQDIISSSLTGNTQPGPLTGSIEFVDSETPSGDHLFDFQNPSQFQSLPGITATQGVKGSGLDDDPDNDHIPGEGGVDYPILTAIPKTGFTCTKRMGRERLMLADPDTGCQVYHVCSTNQKFSFLCPRGTIFHQDTFVCQWWFTVDCQRQAQEVARLRALGDS